MNSRFNTVNQGIILLKLITSREKMGARIIYASLNKKQGAPIKNILKKMTLYWYPKAQIQYTLPSSLYRR